MQGGAPIGYFADSTTAVLDTDFFGSELGRRLIRQGVTVLWREGVTAMLLDEHDQQKEKSRNLRVYQLRPEIDPAKKFITYQKLYEQYGGVDISEYKVVFDGDLKTERLNELYDMLNAAKLPKNYTGHRLSISDIVELYDAHGSAFFYVDAEEYIPIEWEE